MSSPPHPQVHTHFQDVLQAYYTRRALEGKNHSHYESARSLRVLLSERSAKTRKQEMEEFLERTDAEQLVRKQLMKILGQGLPGVSVDDMRKIIERLNLDDVTNVHRPRINVSRVVAVLKKVQINELEPQPGLEASSGLLLPGTLQGDSSSLTTGDRQYTLASEYLAKEEMNKETLAWIRNGFEETTYDYKTKKIESLRELNKELFIDAGWTDEEYNQLIKDRPEEDQQPGGGKFELLKKMIISALGKFVDEKVATVFEEEQREMEEIGPTLGFAAQYGDCQIHTNRMLKKAQLRAWDTRINLYKKGAREEGEGEGEEEEEERRRKRRGKFEVFLK